MNLYLIECDEYVFLTTFQSEHFPTFFPFQSFHPHDTLVFVVQSLIAGTAVVETDEKKVRFTHLFQPENRLPILGNLRSLLSEDWGLQIEESIHTFQAVSEKTAVELLHILDNAPSDIGFYLTNSEHLLEEAQIQWQQQVKKAQKEKVQMKLEGLVRNTESAMPTTDHSKAQFYLKEIAKITNCSVWTASNDKNRLFKGNALGEDDVENFPNFDLDEEVKKRIQLIDTIWFQGDFPIHCFEVETSTSIFSGLLRMSDLLAVMPNPNLKLFIVAPNERKKKVMSEMNRPVFRAIGLPQITRFISIESLELLYQKIKGLDGYISPHVVEAISLTIEEMQASESF